MSLADSFGLRTELAKMSDVADALDSLFDSRWNNWQTYSPTFGSDVGTWTIVEGTSRFMRIGQFVFLSLAISGTTSSTPVELSATLPIVAANVNSNGGGALVRNGGSNRFGAFWRISTTDLIRVVRYDRAALGAGTQRGFEVNCIYRVASE